jgi:hypothetical protein
MMLTILLIIFAFVLGYVYATNKHNSTVIRVETHSISTTTFTKTYNESSMQTPERTYCSTCKMDRTVLAKHTCVKYKYHPQPPPSTSTYRDRTFTLKELQYPAQIGDILLKLRFNQRLGYVNSDGLQAVENNKILTEWGRSKGIQGNTDKVIGETVEAAFAQDLKLLDEYLDSRGVPPITSNSFQIPRL